MASESFFRKKIYGDLPDSEDEDAPMTDAQRWSKQKMLEQRGRTTSKFHAEEGQPQARRRRKVSLWGDPKPEDTDTLDLDVSIFAR